MLAAIRMRFPWLRYVFADGGYAGDKLRSALVGMGKCMIEIIKRSDKAKAFEVLPRRWVVMLNRGPSNDLRTWASRVDRRRGRKRAMVALARRMAVVLDRIWVDGTTFRMEGAPTS